MTDNHTDNDQASIKSSKRATFHGTTTFKRVGVAVQHNHSAHSTNINFGETANVIKSRNMNHAPHNFQKNRTEVRQQMQIEPALHLNPVQMQITYDNYDVDSPLMPRGLELQDS